MSLVTFLLFQYLERDHALGESWLCKSFWFEPYNKASLEIDDEVEVAEKKVDAPNAASDVQASDTTS